MTIKGLVKCHFKRQQVDARQIGLRRRVLYVKHPKFDGEVLARG